LGVAEAMQGKKAQAARHLAYALKYTPMNAEFRSWLEHIQ
jgi:hypothetical protein